MRWTMPTFAQEGRFGRILVPLGFGALAATGQAPLNWGFTTLLGLMGAYALVRLAQNSKAAVRVGWLVGVGYFATALNWIVEPFLVDVAATGWMAPFAVLFMAAGLALFWALAAWVTHRFGKGVFLWASMMALAELARAYVFTGFPWAMPSYAWVNSIVAQSAAWIGPHGLNFLLFLAAGALVIWLDADRPWARIWVLIAPLGISFIPAPGLEMPQDGPIVRLVQPNAPQDEKWDRDKIEGFFERQLGFTAEAGDPDFVVWPETAIAVPIPYADALFLEMAAVAGEAQIVTGVLRLDGGKTYNSLVTLDRAGGVSQVYDKYHLVPFGEYVPLGEWAARIGIRGLAAQDGAGFARGTGPQLLALDGIGPVLPLICYEAIFPQNMRTITRPRLLLQITNDAWFGEFSGPYQHLAQARMRAIETGIPMIRVANTGVSAVIDAKGAIKASIPLGQAGFLDTRLPKEMPQTLYDKTGDLPFGAIILFLGLVATLRARRKTIDGSARQT